AFFKFSKDLIEGLLSYSPFGFGCDSHSRAVGSNFLPYISFLFKIFNKIIYAVILIGKFVFHIKLPKPLNRFIKIARRMGDQLFKYLKEFLKWRPVGFFKFFKNKATAYP